MFSFFSSSSLGRFDESGAVLNHPLPAGGLSSISFAVQKVLICCSDEHGA